MLLFGTIILLPCVHAASSLVPVGKCYKCGCALLHGAVKGTGAVLKYLLSPCYVELSCEVLCHVVFCCVASH